MRYTNEKARRTEFNQQKADGLTLHTKFAEWYAEQYGTTQDAANDEPVETVEATEQVTTEQDAPITEPEAETTQEPVVDTTEPEAETTQEPIQEPTVDTVEPEATTAPAAPVPAVATVSKASIAKAIFDEALEQQKETGVAMVRKDIIARFISEAGLTKPGANTYYQNYREKAGLVNHANK